MHRSVVVSVLLVGAASAFMPTAFKSKSSVSNTALFIESMSKTSDLDAPEVTDPNRNIQAYLKKKNSVLARDNLQGACLVTGAINADGKPEEDIFEMLNSAESGFEYDKIVAFSNDNKATKKRLLSRRSRYSGLLDKLDFMEGTSEGEGEEGEGSSLPTAEQIIAANITNWVAIINEDHLETLETIHNICFECKGTLVNVAMLLTNAIGLNTNRCAEIDAKFAKFSEGFRDEEVPIEERLARKPIEHTIVAVGELEEYPEGTYAYSTKSFGGEGSVILPGAKMSKELAFRFATDLLVLDASSGRSFCFAENNNSTMPEVKLINGMREAGFNHLEELEEIVTGGVEKYVAACRKYGTNVNTDGIQTYSGPNWWEAPEFQEMTQRQKAQTERLKKEQHKSERQVEIEKVARAWMQREYFRMSMAGKLNGLTEEQFEVKMWNKALVEGEKRYKVYMGEEPDEDGEYKLNEERKQQRIEEVMLERARAEMRQLLEEEGENFDDVKGFDELDDSAKDDKE